MRKFDLAPSILFAALYGLLIPLFIYRLCRKRSRTAVLSGTVGFLVERSVLRSIIIYLHRRRMRLLNIRYGRTIMFSLRAVVAPGSVSEQSPGLMEYMQSTLALGFLAMLLDLATLLRCVLVNSTYPDDKTEKPHVSELITEEKSSWRETYDSEALSREKTFTTFRAESLAGQRPDQPRHRFWFRRMTDVMTVLYGVALGTGIAGNALLIDQRENAKNTRANQALR
jgi:hypothetical protein